MRTEVKAHRVSMPRWPAWVLFGTMAACAYPALSASADANKVAPQAAPVSSLASALAR
jgi:hypothetical protein